ncbi:3-hydroxyacyl-CoA dehydrogenase family protein [Kaistia adipata]|uniref:3-hydroxyacyl-CoA dehydrogenase family protein n=1 Tax=Kaistia adipata TaxID=166954 RepID=UPI00041BA80B|nr:3-hydroxyacyl-CoA dehydrogenase family protein [Kaistia adipata]
MRFAPRDTLVGIIGLGLMGKSIAACLLAAGHPVIGYDTDPARRDETLPAVRAMLDELSREGGLATPVDTLLQGLTVAAEIQELAACRIAFEVVTEDLGAKREVFAALEGILAPDAIIASNTSAIPITMLQQGLRSPQRLFGVHWAEPAHLTRFLEIIAGDESAPAFGEHLHALAGRWGKEPTLVRRDIRGFVTNRIMYAMIREAFHIVESGAASVEDVDRSVRNDIGAWATLAGPFRWMDLTGIPAYGAVMTDLMPDLSNATELPRLMRDTIAAGALGTANAKGFHEYTPETAQAWNEAFRRFSMDIRHLQQKYPEPRGDDGP